MRPSDQPRVVAGKYELEKLLGQGGMGEVWVARELATGRKLALKLLKTAEGDTRENRARFDREARIASTLQSPHIVQVTDSGVDGDGAQPFMALELLHGEDLLKRIKTQGKLPVAEVVRLAIQVGRALHVAHSAGLVHRDLKPANIFLARQGDDEVVKVLDFGIAKTGQLDSTQYTAAGAMLGTAAYMSPEQIRSAKTVDHRADLWAFAVVLFRSLTGEMPFTETGFDLFLALMQDPIPTPQKVTALAPGLPAPLNVFFERSFMRDLDQRYPSASAMVVGFCRAAGVTVPPDVLHGAAAPPSGPTSGPAPSAPVPGGPMSSGPAPSAPVPGGPMSSGPAPSAPVPGGPMSGPAASRPGAPMSGGAVSAPGLPPAVSQEPEGLAGTMMLDASMPLPSEHARPPAPGLDAMSLDPDEPDNAATLFYQPGAGDLRTSSSGLPAVAAPPAVPPGHAPGAADLRTSNPALPAASPHLAAAAQGFAPYQEAPRIVPVRPASRAWMWVVLGVVLLLGMGGAAVYFIGQAAP